MPAKEMAPGYLLPGLFFTGIKLKSSFILSGSVLDFNNANTSKSQALTL